MKLNQKRMHFTLKFIVDEEKKKVGISLNKKNSEIDENKYPVRLRST